MLDQMIDSKTTPNFESFTIIDPENAWQSVFFCSAPGVEGVPRQAGGLPRPAAPLGPWNGQVEVWIGVDQRGLHGSNRSCLLPQGSLDGLVGMQQCGVFHISTVQSCDNEFEKEIVHYISTSNAI